MSWQGVPDRRSLAEEVGEKMIVAFSVSPAGGDPDGGVSDAVARAVRVVRESGLPNSTNGG